MGPESDKVKVRVHRPLPAGSAVERRLMVHSTLAWAMAQVGIPGAGRDRGLLGLLVEAGGEEEVVPELLPSACLPGSQQVAPGSASTLLPHLQPLRPSLSLPRSLPRVLRAAEATRLHL